MAWDTSDRKQHLPPGWAKLRQRILQRDGHRCTWLEEGRRCETRATEVDHTGDRDNHHPGMLRSLCTEHHKRHTTSQAIEARRRYPTRRPPEPHPGYR